jgi:uncharacterized protein (TIGR03084 family)
MAAIDDVLADLSAEGEDLDWLLASLDEDQWRLDTPAPGWTIAYQAGHLTVSDELALLATTDPEGFAQRQASLTDDFKGVVEEGAADAAALPPADLLARWRTARSNLLAALAAVPAGEKLPWLLGPIPPATLATTRIMELFAHGQDIRDALGQPPPASDRLRQVAWLGVRTRDFAFTSRGLAPPAEPFRIELTGPDGERWAYGPSGAAQRVTGPALDFCLLVTQRRHRDDLQLTATGPDATRWLGIAQAYLGPPGAGRQPGQFATAR